MFEGGGVLPLPEGKPVRVVVNAGEFVLAMQTIKRITDES